MTLTEFLLARIAEDENTVKGVEAPMPARGLAQIRITAIDKVVGLNIAPARVLAECEAKRLVVAEHEYAKADDGFGCGVCCVGYFSWGAEQMAGECPTLQALASVYSDHPDYRQEWKP